jgi:hypothetical protein
MRLRDFFPEGGLYDYVYMCIIAAWAAGRPLLPRAMRREARGLANMRNLKGTLKRVLNEYARESEAPLRPAEQIVLNHLIELL